MVRVYGLLFGQGVWVGWTAAIHPDDRERVTNRWRELLASGQRGEIEARMYRGARVSLGSRPGGTGQERPGRYRQMVRDQHGHSGSKASGIAPRRGAANT